MRKNQRRADLKKQGIIQEAPNAKKEFKAIFPGNNKNSPLNKKKLGKIIHPKIKKVFKIEHEIFKFIKRYFSFKLNNYPHNYPNNYWNFLFICLLVSFTTYLYFDYFR
jgi:hypothetical protein